MFRLNLRSIDTLKALAELHAQDGLSTDAGLYYAQYSDLMLGKDQRVPAAEALEETVRLIPEDPKHAEKLGELWNLEGEKLKASRANRVSASGGEPEIARNGTFVPPAGAPREGIESTRLGAPSGAAVAQAPAPVPQAPSAERAETPVPPEVADHLAYARTLLASGEREQA